MWSGIYEQTRSESYSKYLASFSFYHHNVGCVQLCRACVVTAHKVNGSAVPLTPFLLFLLAI